jgi:hypothetical protein
MISSSFIGTSSSEPSLQRIALGVLFFGDLDFSFFWAYQIKHSIFLWSSASGDWLPAQKKCDLSYIASLP